MSKISIVEKSKTIKLGKELMVLIPLKLWQKLENYLEDQEALSSKKYLQKIQRGRKSIAKGKFIYPFR